MLPTPPFLTDPYCVYWIENIGNNKSFLFCFVFVFDFFLKLHCDFLHIVHASNFLVYHILKTFTANTNSDDVVDINLPEPVVARYLKIVVVSWNAHPAMRMEVIGYDCSG